MDKNKKNTTYGGEVVLESSAFDMEDAGNVSAPNDNTVPDEEEQ